MSIYGYCENCKMELTSRDQYFGPPELCVGYGLGPMSMLIPHQEGFLFTYLGKE
jgi:hypothetical protein